MNRVAVFPGSFDPLTRGHESIIIRSLPLFSKVIVAIGENSGKRSYFSLEQRITWLKQVFQGEERVVVESYSGLTVDFCQRTGAQYILRGLRTSADFEFERGIGQINRLMYPEIETVFLLTLPEYTSLSSSIVRDIIMNGGEVRQFIPESIYPLPSSQRGDSGKGVSFKPKL
ncbi:MAG: pantetheine-phosphate adenylyltransferase [Bacteroidota bacterium]